MGIKKDRRLCAQRAQVNGLIFGIRFFKLAGGEQHFMLFADGKSTGDSRFSGARGCSHLDGTK